MKHFFKYTRYLLALLIITGLASCRSDPKPASNPSDYKMTPAAMTTKEKDALAGLQWLSDANPEQDAGNELNQASSQSRKPELMAFAGRGLSYPGLDKAQLAAIMDKVDHKVAEGSGDVIYGPTHREMRQKLRTYAIAYNQAIFAAIQ